ncbi:hypothetical protein [Litorivicinus lipolyticus]|nr:hypothetical protein [Litorivicinus lipolyticus]
MGLQAASIIINHLQNGADIPPQLKLEPEPEPELIVRESTA